MTIWEVSTRMSPIGVAVPHADGSLGCITPIVAMSKASSRLVLSSLCRLCKSYAYERLSDRLPETVGVLTLSRGAGLPCGFLAKLRSSVRLR